MPIPPKLQKSIQNGQLPARLLLSGFGSSWDLAIELAGQLQNIAPDKIEAGIEADTLLLRDNDQSFKIGEDHNPDQDTARGLVEWISKKPVAPKRLVILENIERASDAALQSLLKVLEEPPPQGQFIITTQNHHQLLPTVLSRVTLVVLPQNFDDFPLSTPVKDFLESPDLILKMQHIQSLKKAEKETPDSKPVSQFVDDLLLHARFFPQYQNHLEAIFEARASLDRNQNSKLVLETLAMELTKP